QYTFNVEQGFDNIKDQFHKAPTGTSIEYALRRLRDDDRPIAKKLHAKVLTGELSAHRAAVLAGYRKEPTPLEQIQNHNSRREHHGRLGLGVRRDPAAGCCCVPSFSALKK